MKTPIKVFSDWVRSGKDEGMKNNHFKPVMKMIATIGVIAGIKDIKMSMDDITNKKEIRSAVRLNVEAEKVAKDIQEEVKQKGLMSKPEETE